MSFSSFPQILRSWRSDTLHFPILVRVRLPNLAQVIELGEDYDKKLWRVFKCLSGMTNFVFTLEYDGTGRVKWWVDVAFVVHHDMKSHTGGMISMGIGSLYYTSQKLNTKSSTEADLVGVNDLMTQILWVQYFLEAQVIKVSENVVYRDDQSTMKLHRLFFCY